MTTTTWQARRFKDVHTQNITTYRFFKKIAGQKGNIYFCQKGKKMGGHRLCLEGTCPEEYPKSEKIGLC